MINEETMGLILQSSKMKLSELIEEHGEELRNIDPDLITDIFLSGMYASLNAINAIIS